MCGFGIIDETPAAPDCPTQPLKLPTSTSPLATAQEKLTITFPTGTGTRWTMFAALRIPETGADTFAYNNGMPSDRTALTIRTADGAGYISVRFTRDGYIRLVDHTGRTLQATAPGIFGNPGDPIPESYWQFDQSFYAKKGSQLLIGISKVSTQTSGTSSYRVLVTMGGAVAAFYTTTFAAIAPRIVCSGNASGDDPDSLEWFSVWFDNANPMTEAQMRDQMKTLAFAKA